MVIVEPEGWDDMTRSLVAGEIVPVDEPAPPTRCDALQTKLRLAAHLRRAAARPGARGVAVSEVEVAAAMRLRLPPSADRRRAGRRGRAGGLAVGEGRRGAGRVGGRRLGRECRSAGLCRDPARRRRGLSQRHDPLDELGERRRPAAPCCAARSREGRHRLPGAPARRCRCRVSSRDDRLGRIARSIESNAPAICSPACRMRRDPRACFLRLCEDLEGVASVEP